MRIGGDTLWLYQHEFIVEEHEGGDVELVCEFDAMTGEACMNFGTLQIRRL